MICRLVFLIFELVPVSHWLLKSRMRNDCFIGQVPVSTGHPERDVHVPICPHCVSQEAGTRGIFYPSFMQGRPLPEHTQSEIWTVLFFTYCITSIIATFKSILLRFSYSVLLLKTLSYVVVFLRFVFYRHD